MNQYAGGWWLAQLFTMVDPDAVSFRGDFWFAPNNLTRFASMDGRSRVAKAVVMGGLFENGDDLSNETLAAVASKLLGVAAVNEMWMHSVAGRPETAFRPVSSWGGGLLGGVHLAPSTFARKNGDIGAHLLTTAGCIVVFANRCCCLLWVLQRSSTISTSRAASRSRYRTLDY